MKLIQQEKVKHVAYQCGIPSGIRTYERAEIMTKLHQLFLFVQKEESVPQHRTDASIISIFKISSQRDCEKREPNQFKTCLRKIIIKNYLSVQPSNNM